MKKENTMIPASLKILLLSALAILLAVIPSFSQETHYVKKVIDGDTIVLENEEHIRLIGVDTPELHHPRKPVQYFAKEAKEFTLRESLGKKVRLEYDWQRKDKYGRTLAYVYLPEGTCLNEEIIKQGYGHAYTRFPFKYLDSYRETEKQARENRKGLWQSGEDTALVKSGSDLKPQRTKSEYNPGSKEYVKGYYRKNGTYVRGYYRNRKRS